MGEQWKPGDLAMSEYGIAIRVPRRCNNLDHKSAGAHWHLGSGGWLSDGTDARPLAVIDPEDAEQVERLTKVLVEAAHADGNFLVSDNGIHPDTTKRALREYARPTPPKPEEPLGLGAVVKDRTGRRFVRRCSCGSDSCDWWPDQAISDAPPVGWSQIDVPDEAHILSPGVTEADQ